MSLQLAGLPLCQFGPLESRNSVFGGTEMAISIDSCLRGDLEKVMRLSMDQMLLKEKL